MNTNRRKFFGLMGGAAVAGPAVAKEALAKLPTGMGDLGPMVTRAGYGLAQDATSTSGADDWRLREIAGLKRLIAGDLTEEEKEDRRRRRMEARQSLISQHVAGLVSVSPVRKLDIYGARMAALNDEIEKVRMKSYLSSLLEQIGQ